MLKSHDGKNICCVCLLREGLNDVGSPIQHCNDAGCVHVATLAKGPKLAESESQAQIRAVIVQNLTARQRSLAVVEHSSLKTFEEVSRYLGTLIAQYGGGK